MQHKNSKPSTCFSQGFTLMEILISIVIIAIGLLGMVGLQVTTLKNNNNSSMRTQATFLAEGMADRMRANRGALDPDGNSNFSDSTYVGEDTNSVSNPGCITTGCSSLALKNFDMFEWRYGTDLTNDKVDGVNSLPNGRGQISFVPNVAPNPPFENVFRIRIMWDDNRTGATGTGCGTDKEVDLTCFDLEFRP